MRVVHIGTGHLPISPDSSRSVERSLHLLTSNLARHGCDVDIIDIKGDHGGASDARVSYHEVRQQPLAGRNVLSYFLKLILYSR